MSSEITFFITNLDKVHPHCELDTSYKTEISSVLRSNPTYFSLTLSLEANLNFPDRHNYYEIPSCESSSALSFTSLFSS